MQCVRGPVGNRVCGRHGWGRAGGDGGGDGGVGGCDEVAPDGCGELGLKLFITDRIQFERLREQKRMDALSKALTKSGLRKGPGYIPV